MAVDFSPSIPTTPEVLKSLYIRSHALINEIEVAFGNGLNVLTGETGAGKSTILGALNLLLGDRASTEVVRKGSEKAVVEGIFLVAGNKKLEKILAENQIDFTEELPLRREISTKGPSRCFINDTPATLALLSSVGDLLVDLHGQHQHQSLLKVDTHIDLLDDFGRTATRASEFERSYTRLKEAAKKLQDLREQQEHLKEKRELSAFQLKEIDRTNPSPGEEEELEQELTILENAEKLYELTSQLYGLLYEQDDSLRDQVAASSQILEKLERIDTFFKEPVKEISTAEAVIDELAKTIHEYRSKIEFNPEKLEQVRDRLGQLSLLKKKYGGSIEAILEHREHLRKEITFAETFDETLHQLLEEIEKERATCSSIAARLSAKRKEVAQLLNKEIVEELGALGIPKATFEARVSNKVLPEEKNGEDRIVVVKIGGKLYETTSKGMDTVEFYISTNIGEDVKSLPKVASGGEISRIMLALKSILAKADRLPLLIFDEIDIGISGRIAQTVGMSLKALSKFHQIIVITHLAQIASVADHHYLVEKVEEGGRAFTRIRKLAPGHRVREVARLMSGAEITETGLEGAKELMKLK